MDRKPGGWLRPIFRREPKIVGETLLLTSVAHHQEYRNATVADDRDVDHLQMTEHNESYLSRSR